MLSHKTVELLSERVAELEERIASLTKTKQELQNIIDEERWEGSVCSACEGNEVKGGKIVSPHKDTCPHNATKEQPPMRTGLYWFKNRFNPSEGYSVCTAGFRILYQLQDEGPAFLDDMHGPVIWKTIKEARAYIGKNTDRSCIYTIIASDGEIVQ